MAISRPTLPRLTAARADALPDRVDRLAVARQPMMLEPDALLADRLAKLSVHHAAARESLRHLLDRICIISLLDAAAIHGRKAHRARVAARIHDTTVGLIGFERLGGGADRFGPRVGGGIAGRQNTVARGGIHVSVLDNDRGKRPPAALGILPGKLDRHSQILFSA